MSHLSRLLTCSSSTAINSFCVTCGVSGETSRLGTAGDSEEGLTDSAGAAGVSDMFVCYIEVCREPIQQSASFRCKGEDQFEIEGKKMGLFTRDGL